MPPSTQPVSSNIVLPPITAFDHPSREAPVYSLNRPSQYQYLPYPPQVPSSASVEPRATYQPGVPNYQASRQIWPSQPYSLPQQARAPPQDHNLLLAQQPQERSNFKEVKRRTKTGCQTCRKRRIKVSSKVCPVVRAQPLELHAMPFLACPCRATLFQFRQFGQFGWFGWFQFPVRFQFQALLVKLNLQASTCQTLLSRICGPRQITQLPPIP